MDTPKPQPPKKETAKSGAIFDAVLDEATLEQHTELSPEPVAVAEPKISNSSAPKSEYAVVSNNDKDEVSLSKVVYKNLVAKKSLSVHHIQRRLNERGYTQAFLDKDGFYGDHTKEAMAKFQKDSKLSGEGMPDLETLNKLFDNDDNVKVTP